MKKLFLGISMLSMLFIVSSCSKDEVSDVQEEKKTNIEYTVSDYYMWDAYEPYQYSLDAGDWQEGSFWYNNSGSNLASASCLNALSYEDIIRYINANQVDGLPSVYWDNGDIDTEDTGFQTFTAPKKGEKYTSGEIDTYHTGLWLIKREYWDDATKNSENPSEESVTPQIITEENAIDIRKNDKYFFLPAAGYCNDKTFVTGDEGHYWSKTLCESNPYIQYTYQLFFKKGQVSVKKQMSNMGMLPLIIK